MKKDKLVNYIEKCLDLLKIRISNNTKKLLVQIFKFGIVGGIAFIIDYFILIVCKELLNLNILLSSGIAFSISVIYNYIASIKWVFNTKKNSNKKNNFIIFIILSIIGLIITEIIMNIGTNNLNINYLIVKIISTIIVMIFNFITRKIFLENNYDIKININNKIIKFIMAVISYITLCINNIIASYNVISLIILVALIYLFIKYLKFEQKKYFGVIVFSTVFAILLVFGNLCEHYMYSSDVSIIRELFKVRSLFSIIGYFGIFQLTIGNIIPKLCEYEIDKNKKFKINKKKLFILSFIVLIIAWLPYFLSMFPGTLSADSGGELNSAINNILNKDNQTILHLLLLRFCVITGKALFNNIFGIVALYSVIQMIILSMVFSYLIVFLYERKINKYIIALVLLYFAITPIFGYYSIVMWKDIIFAALVLLLTISCFKLYESSNNLSLRKLIPFALVSLLTIFFRNNAIYMYFILILATTIIFKKNRKQLLIIFLIVLGTYYTIKGPVFNYYNVRKSASAEYLAIPMQQIGRMVYKDIEMTEEEEKNINKLIPIETMKSAYDPKCSDGIKFNKKYRGTVFDENKSNYFKLWLSLVFKNPAIALESYGISTLGYWYPNIETRAYENTIVENELGLYTKPLSPQFIQNYVKIMGNKNMPILSFSWSIALLLWLVSISIYITLKKHNIKRLYAYIPIFGIWLTLMIASPVYNEVRYIFSLFTSLPLLLLIPYIDIKNCN